jgi:hypothetical protein
MVMMVVMMVTMVIVDMVVITVMMVVMVKSVTINFSTQHVIGLTFIIQNYSMSIFSNKASCIMSQL